MLCLFPVHPLGASPLEGLEGRAVQLRCGRLVDEPSEDAVPGVGVGDWQRRGRTSTQDIFEDRGLAGAAGHNRDLPRRTDRGVGEGDAGGWGLRRVEDAGYQRVVGFEERVSGEEGRRVPILAHTQEDHVQCSVWPLFAQRSLVRGSLLSRGPGSIDGEDLRRRDGARRQLVEELRLESEVVGVGVVERDAALVGVEHAPRGPVHAVLVRRGDKRGARYLGEGATGEGHREAGGAVARGRAARLLR
mmetsp:Transcript_56604/g.134485  ORF Transcript_56604/g.134485 Transcript_56604/m.134485 type:complete len:246 (+) Transcript_56604:136-873(+)